MPIGVKQETMPAKIMVEKGNFMRRVNLCQGVCCG